MSDSNPVRDIILAFRQQKENREAALSRLTDNEIVDLDLDLEEAQKDLTYYRELVGKEWKKRELEAIRRGEAQVVYDDVTGKPFVVDTEKGRIKREEEENNE
jgi:hypothetical protein